MGSRFRQRLPRDSSKKSFSRRQKSLQQGVYSRQAPSGAFRESLLRQSTTETPGTSFSIHKNKISRLHKIAKISGVDLRSSNLFISRLTQITRNILIQANVINNNTHTRNTDQLTLQSILHLRTRNIPIDMQDIIFNQQRDILCPTQLALCLHILETLIAKIQNLILSHDKILDTDNSINCSYSLIDLLALCS